MSVKQMSLVWEHEFDHPEQQIMLALADHAHDDGSEIRPSVLRLAWKTGYSARQIQRILKRLRDEMKILVLTKEGTGRGHPNVYRFDWAKGVKKSSFEEYKRVTSEARKGDISDIKGDTTTSPEPSLEPSSLEPSCSPKGALAPLKANDLNAKLINRCDEVGFEPNRRQKDGWAKELKTRLEENQPIDQLHASMAKIVDAASNGYYWSFKKAEQGPPGKRNGHASGNPSSANLDNVVDIASNSPEARSRRQEGYEWAFK